MVGLGSDPVGAGLVESLARPGGNVTGLTNLDRELGGKRLELLKEAVPKLARVAVLYDPANPPSLHEVKELLPADARALKLTIQPWEIRAADDFEKVFAALNKQRPDGLYAFGAGRLMRPNRKRIADFALKSRLPSVYSSREAVEAGGLMSYGADLADSYRRVAIYVDKILKGAKPADLPVEQPTKFELVINLKTAKQIGLTIPQKVLARADQGDQMKKGRVSSVECWIETEKDMKKKLTVLALGALLFALCFSAEAQQPKKVPRIAWLTGSTLSSNAHRTEAFRQGLRELGYVEGKILLSNGGVQTEIRITSPRCS